jgi:signal transduction histidine kinase
MRLAAQHLARAHADGAPDFDAILARSVRVIVRQTEKLQRIVTDFRDFARMPAVRREPVDVGELLRHVTDLYARVPGLEVRLDVAPGLPCVTANAEEFERVLINLMGNAVEALDGRAGSLEASAVPTSAGVRIRLRDDGPGIPFELLPRIFDPSFSTKTGGTGLGLAICKRAIDDLGGSISIESADGCGTTVTIELPAAA